MAKLSEWGEDLKVTRVTLRQGIKAAHFEYKRKSIKKHKKNIKARHLTSIWNCQILR